MDNTLNEYIAAYISARVRRGELEPITVRNISNHLYGFARSFGRRPVGQLGPKAVERYIERMETAGLAKSTQAARLSSLRTFARWCVLERIVDRDWMLAAPRVRRPRQVPRDMESVHVTAIIAAARTDRERLIAWLWWGCALRCIEVSRLHVDDYDPVTHTFHVTGKAGHERVVPVPGPVVAAMSEYLSDAGHGSGHLIRRETDRGGPVSAERISGIGRRLVADAGVKVRNYDGRSAHGIRAAAASDMYDACGDPLTVQEYLGHANLQTTSVYLRRRKVEAVRAAQNARCLDEAEVVPFNRRSAHAPPTSRRDAA
jgi:integrase/recombinase XerC